MLWAGSLVGFCFRTWRSLADRISHLKNKHFQSARSSQVQPRWQNWPARTAYTEENFDADIS